jgi:hypothetical protein
MIRKSEFPILEYDDAPRAKLNPDTLQPGTFPTDKMVITFCKRQVLFPKKRHFIFLKCGKLFS